MVKILHIAVSLTGEGIANYLYNYLTHMDLSRFDIDLVINDDPVNNIYEKPLINAGITIYKVCSYEKSTGTWLSQIDHLMRENRYDIVEGHVGIRCNLLCKIAKKNGIPVRIIHTHVAYEPEKIHKTLIRTVFNSYYSRYVTNYFGCSEVALRWTFGKLSTPANSCVIKNAIPTEKFEFSDLLRNQYRFAFHLEHNFVIGCVGRLCFQKNQERLIDIFYEVKKRKSDSKLLLIGEGPDRTMIINKCRELKIVSDVSLLGVRDDVSSFLNAFDAFVLPSRYEGFGIVYLEAQLNRLPTFGTKERVPQNVEISNMMHFISEKDSAEEWAKQIIRESSGGRAGSNLNSTEYDIIEQAKVLENIYLDMVNIQ